MHVSPSAPEEPQLHAPGADRNCGVVRPSYRSMMSLTFSHTVSGVVAGVMALRML